jgi:hypothetical protein
MPVSFKHFDRPAPNKIDAPASIKIGGDRITILRVDVGIIYSTISTMRNAGNCLDLADW